LAKSDRWWEEDAEKAVEMEAAKPEPAKPEPAEEEYNREQAWMEEGFDSIEDWMLYEDTKDGELTEEERRSFVDRMHGGVFGLWWLSPGEAVVIGVVGITAIAVGAFLVLSLATGPKYEYMDGTISDAEVEDWFTIKANITGDGSEWFEESFEIWDEECYDDRCWDEFVGYEYDCYADLNLSFTFDGVEFNGIAFSPAMTTTYPCLSDVESLWYDNGSVIAYMMVGPAEGKTWDDVQVFEFSVRSGKSTYSQFVDIEPGVNTPPNYVFYCGAELDISYDYEESDGTFKQYSAVMETGFWPAREPCIGEMTETGDLAPGSVTRIWVNSGDPSEAGHESTDLPLIGEAVVASMCCLPILIIIVAFALVVARYSNQTAQIGTGYVSNDGGFNRNRIGNNNFYFGGGRGGRRPRDDRKSGTYRRVRSGSRSSSGGSRGGSSGGGSRGGSSGGGSRGGGRRR